MDTALLTPRHREILLLIDNKNYDIKEALTEGANSYSFKGWHRVFNKDIFIKVIDRSVEDSVAIREPNTLLSCKNKNIVPIINAEFLSEDFVIIVTEWVSAGSLTAPISNREISPKSAINVALGILNGISTIHGQNLVHRDIKPGNILYDNNHAYISDFGSVAELLGRDYFISESKHSVLYSPPERILSSRYFRTSDFYQVGLVLAEMLSGPLEYKGHSYVSKKRRKELIDLGTPYEGMDLADQCKEQDRAIETLILKNRLLDTIVPSPWLPKKLNSLIRSMVDVDHTKRPQTVSELSAMLSVIEIPNWISIANSEAKYECSDWRGYDLKIHPVQKPTGDHFQLFSATAGSGNFRRKGGLVPERGIRKLFQQISEW